MRIEFTLNGAPASVDGHPMDRLLDLLRGELALTGTKEGCGEGECGACAVLIDDEPVLSCLVPLLQCQGRRVDTVEGVAANPGAASFLERFVTAGGTQCGACTPGIIVTAWRLAREGRELTREEVREALAGNLCRCTGYEAIVRALAGDDGDEQPSRSARDRDEDDDSESSR